MRGLDVGLVHSPCQPCGGPNSSSVNAWQFGIFAAAVGNWGGHNCWTCCVSGPKFLCIPTTPMAMLASKEPCVACSPKTSLAFRMTARTQWLCAASATAI